MYPSGTIYNIFNPKHSGRSGTVFLHAPRKVKVAYSLIRGLSAGLIGFVIISAIFTFGPLIKEELNYTFYQPSEIELVSAQNTALVQEEAANFGVSSYFSVVIPKINAKANVVANVDPSNEGEYTSALTKGVAHAKGTYFPGQGKNIFLFAHSTNSPLNVARYNAIFYLLDKLSVGDEIIIYFADERYLYKVSETKIVNANDTDTLNQNENGEELILQTCFPPGTSWKRLLVLAKRV